MATVQQGVSFLCLSPAPRSHNNKRSRARQFLCLSTHAAAETKKQKQKRPWDRFFVVTVLRIASWALDGKKGRRNGPTPGPVLSFETRNRIAQPAHLNRLNSHTHGPFCGLVFWHLRKLAVKSSGQHTIVKSPKSVPFFAYLLCECHLQQTSLNVSKRDRAAVTKAGFADTLWGLEKETSSISTASQKCAQSPLLHFAPSPISGGKKKIFFPGKESQVIVRPRLLYFFSSSFLWRTLIFDEHFKELDEEDILGALKVKIHDLAASGRIQHKKRWRPNCSLGAWGAPRSFIKKSQAIENASGFNE